MEYKTLNNSIMMLIVGFGTWNVRHSEGEEIISQALEVGYRLIDSAKMYGNENIV